MKIHDAIVIKGARENNLKNIDIEIPKNKFVVITGLSGSGKSSLAFDTIYAEGQRRYLESLSSYARQFLGGNEKPEVDSIEGLSPAIAIDQKSTSHNPRSTVGTVTEIYDYLRVLFARIGKPYCIKGHGEIKTQTIKQILDSILELEDGAKVQILAPIASNAKGTFKNDFINLKKEGFLRVRVDGATLSLDDEINLEKNKKHKIEIVIDRIVLHRDQQTRSRLYDAIEVTLKQSKGSVIILHEDEELLFNENYSCNECGFAIPELEPRLFSFNSPIGACSQCKGLGFTFEPDEDRMTPNKSLSINQGGIDYFKNTVNTTSIDWQRFNNIIKHYGIDPKAPIKNLTKEDMRHLLYGSEEPIHITIVSSSGSKMEKYEYVEGILALVKRRHFETSSAMAREHYSKYMAEKTCVLCHGKKLSQEALCVLVGTKNIIEITEMVVTDTIDYFLKVKLTDNQTFIAKQVLKEIIDRLTFLKNVGLDYLSLSRTASTLSGGEAQRIRLATQIGSHLTGVLYVLDEPSIGLHQKDNAKLIETLKAMRDLGNTLIIVEHDEETMMQADCLIDIGPRAGIEGGHVVAMGTPQEVMANKDSITGQYLSGTKWIPVPKTRRGGNGRKLILKGASGNNLKKVNITIPLNKFIVVTGVSGSGKSTLILETLVKGIERNNFDPFVKPLPFRDLIGCNHIDKIVKVSQNPIGRTPRSNPATYVGVFDDIRTVFATVPEAKERGYQKSRFSFNIPGGRCDRCRGDGTIRIGMHFLPDVYIKCEECNGHKYNEETLTIKFKGKSIYDILEMPIDEAVDFFRNIPAIHHKLQLMVDVGLGYLKLGASSTTLSGGEAQRIKLAKFLQRRATGKTLFVLDEPTTGLHTDDIARLIDVLNRIVNKGDTVLVIEHNLDLIKVADYVIDLGPEGGNNGGEVIATGTPEQLLSHDHISYTAQYLKKVLYKG